MATPSLLRIAMVQFAPKLGEVHANIAKARELCRVLTPRSVDLVCFPEMIFSGYVFPDAPSIAPYLEHPKTGPTSTFCAELARRLECYVVAGFPERLERPECPASSPPLSPNPTSTTTTTSVPPTDPSPSLIGANAALLCDPTGLLLHTYHKSNLFPTDLTWACPGAGFTTFDLPLPFGRIAVAICNDVNVRARGREAGEWTSIERGPYELAGFCKQENVRVLVLLNAWLKTEEEDESEEEEDTDDTGEDEEEESGVVEASGGVERERDRIAGTGGNGRDEDDADSDAHSGGVKDPNDGDDGLEPNWQVLNYWAMRLRPLWAKDVDASTDQSEMSTSVNDPQERVVVVCNRFGHERGKTFAGSSAMFSMRRDSGKPRLLHVMGEREEGVRVWTARIGPHTPA